VDVNVVVEIPNVSRNKYELGRDAAEAAVRASTRA